MVRNNKSAKQLTDSLALDEINQLLHNKKKLWWLNFQTGLTRGFGGILGAAVAIVFIGLIVSLFGGLPYIGHFLLKIGDALQSK